MNYTAFFIACCIPLIMGVNVMAKNGASQLDTAMIASTVISNASQKLIVCDDFIPEPALREFLAVLNSHYVGHFAISSDVKNRLQTELFRVERTRSFFQGLLYYAGSIIFVQSLMMAFRVNGFQGGGTDLIFWPIGGAFMYGFIHCLEKKLELIESILTRIE